VSENASVKYAARVQLSEMAKAVPGSTPSDVLGPRGTRVTMRVTMRVLQCSQ